MYELNRKNVYFLFKKKRIDFRFPLILQARQHMQQQQGLTSPQSPFPGGGSNPSDPMLLSPHSNQSPGHQSQISPNQMKQQPGYSPNSSTGGAPGLSPNFGGPGGPSPNGPPPGMGGFGGIPGGMAGTISPDIRHSGPATTPGGMPGPGPDLFSGGPPGSMQQQ